MEKTTEEIQLELKIEEAKKIREEAIRKREEFENMTFKEKLMSDPNRYEVVYNLAKDTIFKMITKEYPDLLIKKTYLFEEYFKMFLEEKIRSPNDFMIFKEYKKQ
jgi:hypothetical protein